MRGKRTIRRGVGSEMGHWSGVLRAFDELVSDQAAARAEREGAERTRAEFSEWAEHADDAVLRALSTRLEGRAQELHTRLGVAIEVRYPSERPVAMLGGGCLRFLSAKFGAAEVHVYSTRTPGALPLVHYARAVRAPHERFPRLVSVPGFMVVRGEAGEPLLRSFSASATGHTSIDDVACRVLAMLVAEARTRSLLAEPVLRFA
jgi:hypothetical protein